MAVAVPERWAAYECADYFDGGWAERGHFDEPSQTLVIVPLAFLSAAYVPADTLPGWMRPLADHQPFTVLSNAVRSLTVGGADAVELGHGTAYWVALSLVWCTGIAAVFSSVAVSRFARRR